MLLKRRPGLLLHSLSDDFGNGALHLGGIKMSDHIRQAELEIRQEQPHLSGKSLEEALAYATDYLENHPEKLKVWKDQPTYRPYKYHAEQYLFVEGRLEGSINCEKEKIRKIRAQAKAAGWVPRQILLRLCLFQRSGG